MPSFADYLGYFWGQCTYYAAKATGWIPAGLGNANTWLSRAPSFGLKVSSTPVVGAVAAYNNLSPWGHVAVVQSIDSGKGTVTIGEMNYKGVGIQDTRTVAINAASGYILPPNSTTSTTTVSASPGGTTLGLPNLPSWLQNLLPNNPLSNLTNTVEDWGLRLLLIQLGVAIIIVGLIILFQNQAKTVVAAAVKAAGRYVS